MFNFFRIHFVRYRYRKGRSIDNFEINLEFDIVDICFCDVFAILKTTMMQSVHSERENNQPGHPVKRQGTRLLYSVHQSWARDNIAATT